MWTVQMDHPTWIHWTDLGRDAAKVSHSISILSLYSDLQSILCTFSLPKVAP